MIPVGAHLGSHWWLCICSPDTGSNWSTAPARVIAVRVYSGSCTFVPELNLWSVSSKRTSNPVLNKPGVRSLVSWHCTFVGTKTVPSHPHMATRSVKRKNSTGRERTLLKNCHGKSVYVNGSSVALIATVFYPQSKRLPSLSSRRYYISLLWQFTRVLWLVPAGVFRSRTEFAEPLRWAKIQTSKRLVNRQTLKWLTVGRWLGVQAGSLLPEVFSCPPPSRTFFK